ncbi:MAG: hypothetical protein PVG47_06150 [Chromatiales bacterium]|jgi:hypothetical protein
MKPVLLIALFALFLTLLPGCSGKPDAPLLTLRSIEGTSVELGPETPLTALFFFSMSNPVALGAFERLPDKIHGSADTVGIAMHVDRPPNVLDMQQRTLVPIVIDSDGSLAKAFGGIGLTPSLILVKEGKILLHQEGRLDYDAINATILIQ